MMKLEKILELTNPSKFIVELSDFVTDPNIGGVGKDDLVKAPSLVKGSIFVHAFDLVTFNSGIYKWFVELYDEYPNLADFFDTIHAQRTAAYIRAAVALFPKGRVIRNADKRFDFCDKHEDELNRIDREFKGASEEAIQKLREHIIAHRELFEAQVQEYWKLRKRNKLKFQAFLAAERKKYA